VAFFSVLIVWLAPPGKAVVHAYTAGNEPYSVWEGLRRGSKEYEDLKQQRSQTLWKVMVWRAQFCGVCLAFFLIYGVAGRPGATWQGCGACLDSRQ
jgi:hypothetical protein